MPAEKNERASIPAVDGANAGKESPHRELEVPEPSAASGDVADAAGHQVAQGAAAPAGAGAWFKEFGLYPFFIVLGIVGIFTLFNFLLRDDQTELDYLRQIRTSGGNNRWYAAFQLSNFIGREGEHLRQSPAFLAEVTSLFEETEDDDPRLQRYLAIVLGRVGNSSSHPPLIRALREDDDAQTRMWSAWALGSIGETVAVPALVGALQDSDPAVRKMSVYALGSLNDPRSVGPLEARLADEVEDVRWNAAIALAQLGVGSGYPILRQLVNSMYLSRVEGMTDERVKDVMLSAVKALGVLQATYPSARDLLEETSETAPFPLVQREARRQLDRQGSNGAADG
ncbi:MAG: HEAT repeat domain-containing protein [Candidatus Krumholzibacteriia bacterium]